MNIYIHTHICSDITNLSLFCPQMVVYVCACTCTCAHILLWIYFGPCSCSLYIVVRAAVFGGLSLFMFVCARFLCIWSYMCSCIWWYEFVYVCVSICARAHMLWWVCFGSSSYSLYLVVRAPVYGGMRLLMLASAPFLCIWSHVLLSMVVWVCLCLYICLCVLSLSLSVCISLSTYKDVFVRTLSLSLSFFCIIRDSHICAYNKSRHVE